MDYSKEKSYLNPLRLGLAAGIFVGVMMFIVTLVAAWTHHGEGALRLVADMWPGYSVSFGGSIVGLIYGFIKGFISFFVIAWLYNVLGCCCCHSKNTCDDGSCHK